MDPEFHSMHSIRRTSTDSPWTGTSRWTGMDYVKWRTKKSRGGLLWYPISLRRYPHWEAVMDAILRMHKIQQEFLRWIQQTEQKQEGPNFLGIPSRIIKNTRRWATLRRRVLKTWMAQK